jgi:hypothetical protein
MYLFSHLFTGIVLGLLISDLLHEGRWLIPTAIGAVLPDLIDKPVGYIFLPGIIGYGRFLFHSLPVFTILLVAGLALLKYRSSIALLATDVGILSHQILDSMWREPVNWLDPLLGPFTAHRNIPPDYFLLLLQQNFENPSEWFLGAVFIIGLAVYLERDRVVPVALHHKKGLKMILEGSGIFLWMISGIVFTYGLLRRFLGPSGRFGLDGSVIVSLVIALTAFLFWRWGSALGKDRPAKEA